MLSRVTHWSCAPIPSYLEEIEENCGGKGLLPKNSGGGWRSVWGGEGGGGGPEQSVSFLSLP